MNLKSNMVVVDQNIAYLIYAQTSNMKKFVGARKHFRCPKQLFEFMSHHASRNATINLFFLGKDEEPRVFKKEGFWQPPYVQFEPPRWAAYWKTAVRGMKYSFTNEPTVALMEVNNEEE